MTVQLNNLHKSVLERYSRPVVHMRNQVDTGRFGLVFGAGLSKGFCIPTWPDLIDRLAEDPEIDGQGILQIVPPRTGLPYRTEMLFEHFMQRRYAQAPEDEHHTRTLDFRIASEWREIVRKNLYVRVEIDLGDKLDAHTYLKTYVPLIQNSHMTVTYNFDDLIEQILIRSRLPEEADKSRGF